METVEVSQQPIPQALALTGTLRDRQLHAELAANTAGRVQRTFVERGTEVSQGDLLANTFAQAFDSSHSGWRVFVLTLPTQHLALRFIKLHSLDV